MRIFSLKEEEKKNYTSILPEGIGAGDSLIIVTEDDKAQNALVVGVMVLSAAAPALWSLDYLMVAESHRRQNIAKNMMVYGGFLIRSMGASVLSATIMNTDADEEGEALKQCLLKAGFTLSSEKTVSAISIDAVCDHMSPYVEHADMNGMLPLSRVGSDMWKEITSSLSEMFEAEDLIVPLHDISYYNKDISIVSLDPSGLCRGLILISDIEEDISVDYLWSAGSNGMITMSLLVAALNRVKNGCDVLFDAHTRLGKRLIERLFGSDIRSRYSALEMTLSLN